MAFDLHDQIFYTDELHEIWTTWFIYGQSGSGKTTAAATFPAPLFLTPKNERSENALVRVARFPVIRIGEEKSTGRRLPIMDHTNQILAGLEDMHGQYRRLLQQSDVARQVGDLAKAATLQDEAFAAFPFETIVMESLTHLCDLVVEDLSNFGRTAMQTQHWGVLSTFLRTIHDRLRALPVHVIYTALDTLDDKSSAIARGEPDIVGKMRRKLPSACDVVAYTREVKGPQGPVYEMHFRSCGPFFARARGLGFPEMTNSFHFSNFEPLLGSLKAQETDNGDSSTAD